MYDKEWYRRNRSAILAAQRRYREKNREKILEANRIRREIYEFGSTRAVILERFGYTCCECGAKNNLEVHHRDGNGSGKRKDEKNNDPKNLIVLCQKCHKGKHGRKLVNKWSRKYEKCVMCGTIKIKHDSFGMCRSCKTKWRRNRRP